MPTQETNVRALGTDRRLLFMRRLLIAADSLGIASACALSVVLEPLAPFSSFPGLFLLAPVGVLLWLGMSGISGMYHVDEKRLDCSVADDLGRIVQLAAVWVWSLLFLELLATSGAPHVAAAATLWVFTVPAILLCRAASRKFAQRQAWYRQAALVVGSSEDIRRVTRMLDRHPEYGIEVVGRHVLMSATARSLPTLAEDQGVDRIIFASSPHGLAEKTGVLRSLTESGLKVDLVPGDSEIFGNDAELHFAEGLPLLTLPTINGPRSASFAKRASKRAMDLSAALIGLCLLAPILIFAAIRIRLDSPGPALFRQLRTGMDGEPFYVVKFRTMDNDAEERRQDLIAHSLHMDNKFKVVDDPRVTPFGAKLRRTSLDELPQLVNVIRGEMSLVGPRPLPVSESDTISDHYRARFDVRPGITGPWQVFGRSDIPFREMLKLDYAYVKNWSLQDDFKLLMRTVSAIGQGRGAY